ncbi:SUMF1/EgtB/PvdO family nonheme iron enzyme [Chloracidobacterium validum]|uniref:SUMF1/EgtB/PvdO family nonheme iron enzyme n=1 Tax=Chloracidobacterium validum TaxID=2821543 RepID=A0ABX8BA67_9BACT|nr:SUMF1/EgtB/PvdO family nonheme iron enzyme [Chloracidobacterium validum]QUW01950.1 SUMF1/EgtB/PvdO family nonheme iron enzyme [Chloracidobacterium validum]
MPTALDPPPATLDTSAMNKKLGDYLREYGGPLPTQDTLALFLGIAKVVNGMHEQFAFYGSELRVENIILSNEQPLRVLDCGIPQSRLAATSPTPDEVERGIRRDIHQLGAILYHLATGQPAPERRSTYNFRTDFDEASDLPPVPDPRTAHPAVSLEIARLVAKATARDAQSQAKRIGELLELLDAQAETKPDIEAPAARPSLSLPASSAEPAAPSGNEPPARREAKVTLARRALPVVSERTGFVMNEATLKADAPTPSAPSTLVEGLAQAFADLSGTGERPTGKGFRFFLAGVSGLLLLVVSLVTYRIVEKFFLGGGQGAATRPNIEAIRREAEMANRPKLVPTVAPDDISAARPPLVAVKGGTFEMGSLDGQPDEQPVRRVTLSDFEIGKYEVTNAQYKAFCDATRRPYPEEPNFAKLRNYFLDYPTHPVVRVSWDDANAYCVWLSEQTGDLYRLPTEAEWEYVARDSPIGWDSYNSGGAPHEVGTSVPNALGIYDLMGNVWEWCADWYGPYPTEPQTNPKGLPRGTHKVLRGCSWYFSTVPCRTTSRFRFDPTLNYWFNGGFRVVRARH